MNLSSKTSNHIPNPQINTSLNILKGIACFCVVTIHCMFPGLPGRIIYCFSRFAVPLFFAVAGYYVYAEDKEFVRRRLPGKIRHVAVLFLQAEIIYLLWHCMECIILYGNFLSVLEWIKSVLTYENIAELFVFQKTFVGDVSWFLVALLLCYCCTYLINACHLWKMTFFVAPVLLFLNLLIGELNVLGCEKVPWFWCSNFWLLG
ncbi:MAG: acyltransferase family protein [Eubacteriales bacterium]|nr:acyltransferase family protein [Eubacteriales bacterium]